MIGAAITILIYIIGAAACAILLDCWMVGRSAHRRIMERFKGEDQ